METLKNIALVWSILIILSLHIHTAAVKVILEDNKEGVVEKVVTVGNRVELKCRGDGTGQQVLSWTFRSSLVESAILAVVEDNRIVASTANRFTLQGTNLIINRMEREDEGEYMCRIVTPGKVEHGDGKYIVRTFQALSQTVCGFPDYQRLVLYRKFYMSCINKAFPPPLFEWYKNGILLHTTHRYQYNKQNGQFIFENVTKQDEGNYYCKASKGDRSSSCQETFLSAGPEVVLIENRQTGLFEKSVTPGSSVTLQCTLAGGAGQVDWYYRPIEGILTASRIVKSNVVEERFQQRFKVDRTFLVIEDVASADVGYYQCRQAGLTLIPTFEEGTYLLTLGDFDIATLLAAVFGSLAIVVIGIFVIYRTRRKRKWIRKKVRRTGSHGSVVPSYVYEYDYENYAYDGDYGYDYGQYGGEATSRHSSRSGRSRRR